MKAATFTCDVTAPIGAPLCGGWIAPASRIDDLQYAHGLILQPDGGEPVVMCAVDWCWIRGEAHERWREALAEAVGTRPNRVAVHCVHPHDAPMAAPEADRILAAEKLDLRTLLPGFLDNVLLRAAAAARAACRNYVEVTVIGTGAGRVEQVGCNRRVVGPSGKVELWRGSSCKDPKARAAPEGLIDPWLRCVSFWTSQGRGSSLPQRCIAALHYYACHPMSYYGKGGVSPDFAGLARAQLRARTPGTAHIYFNGCGGNVAPGKYNDGSPENRPVLQGRLYAGMDHAFESSRLEPIRSFSWSVEPVHFPMSEVFTREFFTTNLRSPKATVAERIKGAMGVAWWDRYEAGKKIDLARLRINDVFVLHLPGEMFVEYQLAAQRIARELQGGGAPGSQPEPTPEQRPFVAVAAYGDCGPAYVPTAEAYSQGGYEVTMAWAGPKTEELLKAAMRRLLA